MQLFQEEEENVQFAHRAEAIGHSPQPTDELACGGRVHLQDRQHLAETTRRDA